MFGAQGDHGFTERMTKVLILGGTAWLGREIAEAFVASGAEVTCLARGESGAVPIGARLVKADRTQPRAYTAVSGTVWDEVVELSYDPSFVADALDALTDKAAHWTLISTVSVYSSNRDIDADELAAIHTPTDLDDYGQAKVAAEQVSSAALSDRLMIARPGLIAGPGDPSDRLGYWVSRLALAHELPVLSPKPEDRYVQFIDVRDFASWVVNSSARSLTGVVNVIGDPMPFAEFLEGAKAVAGFTGEVREAHDDWLLAHDVTYWSGPRALPLWLPAEDVAFARRSNARFRQTEGGLRPLAETLAATLEDEKRRGLERPRKAGLSRENELSLLTELQG